MEDATQRAAIHRSKAGTNQISHIGINGRQFSRFAQPPQRGRQRRADPSWPVR